MYLKFCDMNQLCVELKNNVNYLCIGEILNIFQEMIILTETRN